MKILGIIIKTILYLIIIVFFVGISGLDIIVVLPLLLMFGWIRFVLKVFPYVEPNIWMIGSGIAAVVVLTVGVHRFCRWFYEQYETSPDETSKQQWRLRWSLAGVAIFILMFVTSIAVTGFLHQAKWLTDEPVIEDRFRQRAMIIHTEIMMKSIGTALVAYKLDNKSYPKSFGTVDIEKAGLLTEKHCEKCSYKDAWGTPFAYTSDGSSYILRSYGKNRILGGGDDIVYSNGDYLRPD